MKWENKKDVSQRDYIVKILNIEDVHKSKNKNVLVNNSNNFQNNKSEFENNKSNIDIFDNKNLIINSQNKNSEELDLDIDFV